MSKNQIALDEGRITQEQYDSMACYKATQYCNCEDLDVETDYTNWGVYKVYPHFCIKTHNGRDVVSPEGFIRHVTAGTVLDDLDIDDITGDGDYVTFICKNSWNWAWDGDDPFEGDDFWDGLHQYIDYGIDVWE